MASVSSVRACSRCHMRKVRCSGFPDCQNCSSASVQCERYKRPTRGETSEALARARQRVQWLEGELLLHFQCDCRSLPTGSSLRSLRQASLASRRSQPAEAASLEGSWAEERDSAATASPRQGDIDSSLATISAPDISLLAFNATGETKYLGPSSGAFFAAYATAVVQSFKSCGDIRRRTFSLAPNSINSNGIMVSPTEEPRSLSSSDIQRLLRSYQMWVDPLYPLLDPEFLEGLAVRCHGLQQISHDELAEVPTRYTDMTIFYLVMALGAANYDNTLKHDISQEQLIPKLSPSYFYSKAMQCFDQNPQRLQTNISTIQIILLISIYSSFGPVSSNQWQLAGLAMRMAVEIGLHHAPKKPQKLPVQDRENRVFWTAYVIEISLAYNLGRPPSIGEEYITSSLPKFRDETCLGIYHIKHRKIQSRIISQVYCSPNVAKMSLDERHGVISKLQGELDEWKSALLSAMPRSNVGSPYPLSYWDRLYHGTSFVLHRASPLCPHPSPQSLEQCIRSAGEYINCMFEVLRNSNVPLSWMLIQGVIFAGLTMLITARTGVSVLTRQTGLQFLLVDLPSWTRKCSICLAIMNERWSEDLIAKLDTQFEALANDTLKMITSSVTAPVTTGQAHHLHTDLNANPPVQHQTMLSSFVQQDDALANDMTDLNDGMIGDWEQLQFVQDFIGRQTFWDIFPFPLDTNIDEAQPGTLNDEAMYDDGWPG